MAPTEGGSAERPSPGAHRLRQAGTRDVVRRGQLLLAAQGARRGHQVLPAGHPGPAALRLRLQPARPRVLPRRGDGQGPLLLPQGHLPRQPPLQRLVRHQHDPPQAGEVPPRREVPEEGAPHQPAQLHAHVPHRRRLPLAQAVRQGAADPRPGLGHRAQEHAVQVPPRLHPLLARQVRGGAGGVREAAAHHPQGVAHLLHDQQDAQEAQERALVAHVHELGHGPGPEGRQQPAEGEHRQALRRRLGLDLRQGARDYQHM